MIELLGGAWGWCGGCGCIAIVARFMGGWCPAVGGSVVAPVLVLVTVAFIGLSGGAEPWVVGLLTMGI